MSDWNRTTKAGCDKLTLNGRCGRKPYQMVYKMIEKDGIKAISLKPFFYLCRFHYYTDKIKAIILHRHRYYFRVDE